MLNTRGLNEMAAELGRVGGWAPGNYLGKCRSCEREFTGDKRAVECLPCATASLKTRVAAIQSAVRTASRPILESCHYLLVLNYSSIYKED